MFVVVSLLSDNFTMSNFPFKVMAFLLLEALPSEESALCLGDINEAKHQ